MDSRSRDSKRRRMDTSLSTNKRSRERQSYRSPDNRHSNDFVNFESAYKDDALPSFFPNDPEQTIEKWLRKVDEVRKIYKWNEFNTMLHALSKLKGSAEVWYKSLPQLKFTWDEWKEKLIQAFPSTKDYYEQLEEMVQRKKLPDETYSKYFFDKLALINLCRITGRDAVACVIGGLSDEIKPSARIGNFKEPEEIYEYLQSLNSVPPNKDNFAIVKSIDSERKDKISRSSYSKRDKRETYRSKNAESYSRDIEARSSFRDKDLRETFREKDIKGSYKEKDNNRDNFRERDGRFNDKNIMVPYQEKDSRDLYREKDHRVNFRDKEMRETYLDKEVKTSYSFREKDLRITLSENSLKCFSCGEVGHYAKDCQKYKETRYCKFCFRTGHTEDRCYDKKLTL